MGGIAASHFYILACTITLYSQVIIPCLFFAFIEGTVLKVIRPITAKIRLIHATGILQYMASESIAVILYAGYTRI